MDHPHIFLQKTPIYLRTHELYKVFYGYLSSFPRKDRYTLGQKCEAVLLEVMEAVIVAGSLSKQEKLPVLKRASIKVDVLRALFSLGKDLKIIDNKKYMVLEKLLTEIGKMLGGWIKNTNNQS